MNKQFTASEVRAEIDQAFRYHVNDMLRAYADLLEEREKTVPMGCLYSLYTQSQSAPSDAERLAEALRSIGESLSSVLCDPFDEVVVRGSGGDRQVLTQALKGLGELATHHAQAQPPAASVTDAMVERGLKACIQDSDARLPRYKVVRSIIEAALAAQENPNG